MRSLQEGCAIQYVSSSGRTTMVHRRADLGERATSRWTHIASMLAFLVIASIHFVVSHVRRTELCLR